MTKCRDFVVYFIFVMYMCIIICHTNKQMADQFYTSFEWIRRIRIYFFGCIHFYYFNILYVFEVKESVSRSFTKLPCLSDLENPGQLPVLQVLKGTDDWVSRIFEISLFLTFSRSRNPFLTFSQS